MARQSGSSDRRLHTLSAHTHMELVTATGAEDPLRDAKLTSRCTKRCTTPRVAQAPSHATQPLRTHVRGGNATMRRRSHALASHALSTRLVGEAAQTHHRGFNHPCHTLFRRRTLRAQEPGMALLSNTAAMRSPAVRDEHMSPANANNHCARLHRPEAVVTVRHACLSHKGVATCQH
jgi:hypothetical protein